MELNFMQSFNDVWNLVLDEIKKEFSENTMRLWFNELELVLLTDNAAVLAINSNFKRDMIEKRFLETIDKYMAQILGFEINTYIVSTENGPIDLSKFENTTAEEASKPASNVFEQKSYEKPADSKEDNKHFDYNEVKEENEKQDPIYSSNDYTFDTFIVGNSNKFAHAACTAVAHSPAREYNPLFIYGPSGLGKTHLLYAITHEITARNPMTNIIYVKGEEFTNQMIDSIAKNYTSKFRDKYRKADVLLIDDIQFIAGRESTQEEFFHTFNALYEEHKQIIMTSDRPPRDIKLLEDRLKTRFEWGLIADIQPPDFELRIAIMKNKAKMIGFTIPNDVLNFLAENLRSNVRQIEGAVKKISAQSFLTGAPITIELATSCVSDLLSGSEPVTITIDKILDTVSKKYGVPVDEIKARKRTKEIALARHVSVYIIRKVTDMSLPAIGKVFGRDHTTVLSSIDTIEKEIKNNPVFEMDMNDLIKEIKS